MNFEEIIDRHYSGKLKNFKKEQRNYKLYEFLENYHPSKKAREHYRLQRLCIELRMFGILELMRLDANH